MQGIGFIIAGLAPWFSGVLRSISGNYLMDWAFHALCVVGLMIITLRFAQHVFRSCGSKRHDATPCSCALFMPDAADVRTLNL